MSKFISPGLGWHRDLPDLRDYSPAHPEIKALLQTLKRPRGARSPRPSRVDWREFCPPIEDQAGLNASPAHACLALLQYFERRGFGTVLEPSRLFLYKMMRQLMNWTGDTGASLRTMLKAMIRFGIPRKRSGPLEPAGLDHQPEPFLFACAQDLQSLHYLRLDRRGANGAKTFETTRPTSVGGRTRPISWCHILKATPSPIVGGVLRCMRARARGRSACEVQIGRYRSRLHNVPQNNCDRECRPNHKLAGQIAISGRSSSSACVGWAEW
jgi:hypothetical protein